MHSPILRINDINNVFFKLVMFHVLASYPFIILESLMTIKFV